jgi:hypothetical protein
MWSHKPIFSYFPYFERIKVSLWDHLAVCVSVSVNSPLWTLECLNQISETRYVFYGIWGHLNGVFHKSFRSVFVSVCVSLPIVARQQLGKHIHAAAKNCWRRCFLHRPCRVKWESVGLSVYPPIVARQRLGKHFHAATKSCWRRRFLCGPCRIKGK